LYEEEVVSQGVELRSERKARDSRRRLQGTAEGKGGLRPARVKRGVHSPHCRDNRIRKRTPRKRTGLVVCIGKAPSRGGGRPTLRQSLKQQFKGRRRLGRLRRASGVGTVDERKEGIH